MAMNMDPDFKEKTEEKGVKTEGASEDATIRFDFQASTSATSPSVRGMEGQGKSEVELKEFSIWPEKYDRKGDFESWVNQFEVYVTLGTTLGQ